MASLIIFSVLLMSFGLVEMQAEDANLDAKFVPVSDTISVNPSGSAPSSGPGSQGTTIVGDPCKDNDDCYAAKCSAQTKTCCFAAGTVCSGLPGVCCPGTYCSQGVCLSQAAIQRFRRRGGPRPVYGRPAYNSRPAYNTNSRPVYG